MNSHDKNVTIHAEEYLEAIYRLECKDGSAKTMELSRTLNVVPGSITNTIQSLERKGLVIHQPYRGVKLTEDGRQIASQILRRHRLAERLLTDFLNLDWTEVHDPACKLEHAFSADIIKALEKALGHPKTCPHGNPIPTNCGAIFEQKTVPLTELETKMCAEIAKITEEKEEILKQLAKQSLIPGKSVVIENKTDSGDSYVVRVDDQTYTIDGTLASVIYVKVHKGGESN
ncbi:MAG: metal-dependent transcriptional regulator [Candidatus Bathyarchaeota archaeon]|nr:metal-dependent transcriptional regulator [Candidatus Bathyarchaeota archaeon]